jgi:hypothetical protein
MAARIIQFPGPKPKPEPNPEMNHEVESSINQAPHPPRELSARELEHRRQMLLHLTRISG